MSSRYRLAVCILLCLAVCLFPFRNYGADAPSSNIMIAAVSRNEAVLAGGISTGKWTQAGLAVVEPVAWLSPTGRWTDLPCNFRWVTSVDIALCRAFAQNYLADPHPYTIVSHGGYGDTLIVPPTALGSCEEFDTVVPYAGGLPVDTTSIAASDPAQFMKPHPLTPVQGSAYSKFFSAFAAAAPVQASSLQGLRFFQLLLQGQSLVVVQRSFADFAEAGPSETATVKLIFAIGQMQGSHFQMLYWKRNITVENEQVLGTILLRNGHSFLITSVNEPESQFFRIYAWQHGQLKMVFQGGGYSC